MIKTVTPNSAAAIASREAETSKTKLNPKSQFVGTALSMSWQLAIVVLIPVIGGYKIDQHFKTLPTFTVAGLVLSMIGTIVIIKKALNQLSDGFSRADKS